MRLSVLEIKGMVRLAERLDQRPCLRLACLGLVADERRACPALQCLLDALREGGRAPRAMRLLAVRLLGSALTLQVLLGRRDLGLATSCWR